MDGLLYVGPVLNYQFDRCVWANIDTPSAAPACFAYQGLTASHFNRAHEAYAIFSTGAAAGTYVV